MPITTPHIKEYENDEASCNSDSKLLNERIRMRARMSIQSTTIARPALRTPASLNIVIQTKNQGFQTTIVQINRVYLQTVNRALTKPQHSLVAFGS